MTDPNVPAAATPPPGPFSTQPAAAAMTGGAYPGGASSKSFIATWLLSYLLGFLGIDRFYLGKVGTGILKLVTFGGAGIWWLIDLILTLAGAAKDSSRLPVKGTKRQHLVAWIVTAALIVLGIVLGAATPKTAPAVLPGTSAVAGALPVGSPVSVKGMTNAYTITIDAVKWDATDDVVNAAAINPKPPIGEQYATANVTIKNNDSLLFLSPYVGAFTTDVWLVVNGQKVIVGAAVSLPDGLATATNLAPDGSVSGRIVIMVPTGTTSGAWHFSDGTIVAAQ